ncbi:MAG: DUF4956 domain-containing protein [Clostridia bacterium]|nr:DUF4956 domain-containing protein [Clostridia bacterium]
MEKIFESITAGGFSPEGYCYCLLAALFCGVVAAFAASYKSGVSRGFTLTLIVLPVIVQTVITMVNGNVGTGVAVMGAFSLVRFRSVPGRARDIAAIFLSMTAGLACAAGYIVLAALFTVFVAAILLICSRIPTGGMVELRITVPENLQFTGAFDEVFQKHTSSHKLVSVKTCNMGSLYKLKYQVSLRDRGAVKEFIDDIRCRNGNLEVSVAETGEGSETL